VIIQCSASEQHKHKLTLLLISRPIFIQIETKSNRFVLGIFLLAPQIYVLIWYVGLATSAGNTLHPRVHPTSCMFTKHFARQWRRLTLDVFELSGWQTKTHTHKNTLPHIRISMWPLI
jgi:hypothetical protein